MGIVVSLIILGVGVFAFFTVESEVEKQGYSSSGTKCQAVADPTVQQTINIGRDATEIVVKEKLSDGTWQTIDILDWSYAGSIVTATVTGG